MSRSRYHFILWSVIYGFSALLWVSTGQAQTSAELHERGIQLLNAGEVDQAVETLEQFVERYPTASEIYDVRLRLGYGYMLQGEFDKALGELRQVTDEPAPQDIRRTSRSLIPQALSVKAGAMDREDEERTPTFEEALAAFDTFLEAFPEAVEVEQAVFGRAIVNYQLERYDDAASDLRSNLQRFPGSDTIGDSQYMLALTLATQAGLLLSADAPTDADRQQAWQYFREAEGLLQGIIDAGIDVSLANDSRFQLGELYSRMGRAADDDEADQYFEKAITFFRTVAPNDEMIEAQEQRVLGVRDRIREALMDGDTARVQRLQTLRDRELAKLGDLEEREEQTVAAKLQIADVYTAMGRYDETRVMVRYLDPFLETEDQEKLALYLLTLSYAAQNARDPALAAYETFQSNFPADPMAENLPLLVGNIFLSEEYYDPGRAAEFFESAQEMYPDGQLTDLARLQSAQAWMQMGDYERSLEVFREYLAGNPEPHLAVTAQMGISDIYSILGDYQSAYNGYDRIRETYPGTREGVEADFRVAIMLLSMNRNEEVIEELSGFLERHEDPPQEAAALFTLGEAKVNLGMNDEAMVDFRAVIEGFPGTEAAVYAYFQVASILSQQERYEEMNETLREYLAEYPDDEMVFFAYEMMSRPHLFEDDYDGAADVYAEFASRYPNRRAEVAEAYDSIASWTKTSAQNMGRYVTLTEDDRIVWQERLERSQDAAERLIEYDDEGEFITSGLQTLMDVQRFYLNAGLRRGSEIEAYLQDLAETHAADADRQNQILFTLAEFLYENDEERALAIMQEAYSPNLMFAPDQLNLFGQALLDAGELEDAEAVYTKVAEDFPIPEGVPPAEASYDVQIAQSTYLYGMGRISQERGDTAAMEEFYSALRANYPWSPKILEVNLGLAQAMIEAGNYEEALPMLTPIIRAQTATAELRARAMFTLADAQDRMGNLEAAIDNFIKISRFYAGVDNVAAEGLLRGGQLLEKQAGQLTDPAGRQRALQNARRAYQDLIERYPGSTHVSEARSRLQSLAGT